MARKRTRWVCPECGKGALGPQRPRRNATVRYCLPCSQRAGVLVERQAPALERRRAEREAARKAKAARKRATKQEREDALYVYGGVDLRVDLRVEAKRIMAHPEVGCPRATWCVRRRRQGRHLTGVSYGGRVVLTIPAGASAGQALAILAHELAHEATRGDQHGDRWRAVFLGVVQDLYGAEVAPADSYMDLHANVARALDVALTETSQEETP